MQGVPVSEGASSHEGLERTLGDRHVRDRLIATPHTGASLTELSPHCMSSDAGC